MNIKIAVCDDEKIALQAICGAVKKVFDCEGITADTTAFSSLTELKSIIERERFDIVMLDIEMNEKKTGLDFAEWLRKSGINAEIIFVSNCENKVYESFRFAPLAFVRKSKFIADLSNCMPLIKSKLESKESGDYLTLSNSCRIEKIATDDILYIEGNLKRQVFRLADGKEYYAKKTMKETEELLADKGFLRIHSGYIVNLSKIFVINNKEVVLLDKSSLPISRSRISLVKNAYLEYLRKNDVKGL